MIALDANVFLLLVVGLTNPNFIPQHKRTKKFTEADFKTLLLFIEDYDEAVVTPNALTEVSNILDGSMKDPAPALLSQTMQALIGRTREIYVESQEAAARPEFHRLGLTDAAYLQVAKQDIFILSTDGPLCRAAVAAGYGAQHFTELTEAAREVLR